MCSLAVKFLLGQLCGAIGGGMRGAIFFTLLPLGCHCHATNILEFGEIKGRGVNPKAALGGQLQ